ncbi:MAG TPA: TetR/AcrR family transcriptional regulator [Ilumatobacteraceae bacterium]|nr:TetR/AcrR family transcriptional regulator [Ilumatobacteraceae bacterium]
MADRSDARERLLDTAERLMWERGYEAVGVAELCAQAGAPRGSFYYWWPSKHALALAMIERSWERTKAALFEPAFGRDAPFAEQLDDYVERLVNRLECARQATSRVPGCRFGNLAAELSTRDPDVRHAIDAVFTDMQRIFADAITKSIASSELATDVDPDGAAEALCAHMEGLMILAKARNDPAIVRRLSVDGRRLAGAKFDDPLRAQSC